MLIWGKPTAPGITFAPPEATTLSCLLMSIALQKDHNFQLPEDVQSPGLKSTHKTNQFVQSSLQAAFVPCSYTSHVQENLTHISLRKQQLYLKRVLPLPSYIKLDAHHLVSVH